MGTAVGLILGSVAAVGMIWALARAFREWQDRRLEKSLQKFEAAVQSAMDALAGPADEPPDR